MPDRALTSTSYLVLGLVRSSEPCTAYDMKQQVRDTIGLYWSFPHSQLYAEPARLVEQGLLTEYQEETGRRRRLFRITSAGERALDDWLSDHDEPDIGDHRDDGLLKLHFIDALDRDEIVALARARADAHNDRIARVRALRSRFRPANGNGGTGETLELGLRWDLAAASFWNEIAAAASADNGV